MKINRSSDNFLEGKIKVIKGFEGRLSIGAELSTRAVE